MISSRFLPFVRDLASATGLGAKFRASALPEMAVKVVARRLTAATSKATLAGLKGKEKRRYIVAPPLHQQSAGPATTAGLRALHDALINTDAIVRSENETGRKVLRLSPLEAAVLREKFSGLLVEEDVQYKLARTPLLGEINAISVPQSTARQLTVHVRGGGGPVAGARVVLFTDVAAKRGYEGVTGPNGDVVFSIRRADTRFERSVVLPHSGFWSRVWKSKSVSSPLTLDVLPLQVAGFDWGLQTTEAKANGVYAQGTYLGTGVKVAIIDTGIAPHPSLRIAGGRNFIEGEGSNRWDDDLEGHGTHCAGVVSAIARRGSVWGYAPETSLYALRVFGGADRGGYASDIGDAIEWALGEGCDIISMSLGSETASGYIRSKIEKATDAGVLCVAAAGNEGGPVSYPARFRNVIGVSAIGKVGTYPKDSIHRDAESAVRSPDGKYFLASFSNRGEEVDVCAPGVAITSTLPANAYGAWDGTSMACPHITGMAALALEAAPSIRTAPRDAGRMGMLIDRLHGLCVDLGLGRTNQGAGLPLLSRL